jgi:hypothetical protein
MFFSTILAISALALGLPFRFIPRVYGLKLRLVKGTIP